MNGLTFLSDPMENNGRSHKELITLIFGQIQILREMYFDNCVEYLVIYFWSGLFSEYLSENYSSGANLQFIFKYFVNMCFKCQNIIIEKNKR